MSSEELKNFQETIEDYRKKRLKDIIYLLLPLFGIHIIMMYQFMPPEYSEGPFWAVDIFLFLLTVFGFRGVSGRFKKDKDNFVKIFMTHSTVKVFAIMLFLAVWLGSNAGLSRPILLQFLILLVPVLFIETISLIKMVNLPFDEKKEKS